MLNGIFDIDKPFWRWIGKIPEMIGLSICWYFCCLPLITFIPASCALYDAASRNLVPDEKGCFKRFFRTFVKELKKGIPLSILWLAIILLSAFGIAIVYQNAETSSLFSFLFCFYLIMFAMLIGYLGWLIPLQSRFHQSFWGLHINALRFLFGRLWGSIAIFLITAAVIAVCFIHHATLPLIIVAPCLIAIFHSIPVERAFRAALPEYHEEESDLED